MTYLRRSVNINLNGPTYLGGRRGFYCLRPIKQICSEMGDDDFQFLGPFAGRKCVCAHAIIQLNICNGFFDLPCYFLTSSFCPRC